MNDPFRDHQALNNAIDDLVDEMARVTPELLRDNAREAIRRIVEDLLRDAGKVDEPGALLPRDIPPEDVESGTGPPGDVPPEPRRR